MSASSVKPNSSSKNVGWNILAGKFRADFWAKLFGWKCQNVWRTYLPTSWSVKVLEMLTHLKIAINSKSKMKICYQQYIWWRYCCQNHNCGQKSIQLRLFISDAHIRDIRYRIQWGISIFSFTCHHLLRPRQILYFSQVFNTHFTFIVSQFTKVTMKKIMTMMKIQQARVYYSKWAGSKFMAIDNKFSVRHWNTQCWWPPGWWRW